jgi:ferredoxin-NADP reductase
LRAGDQIELRGPIGGYFVWNANDPKNHNSPLLLVAGGSGIAPLMAMIHHRVNAQEKVPVKLLYSSRFYDDAIYRAELDHLAATDSSLQVIYTFTRRQPPDWKDYRRRIDQAMLMETIWPAADNLLAFACGPTALVETVATYLLGLGYDRERIKTERFGPTGDENHL